MNIIFLFVFIFLILAFIAVAIFLFVQTRKEKKAFLINFVDDILDKKDFYVKEIIYVNPSVVIAINKKNTTIAVIIKNDSSDNYVYEEINSYFITSIDKNPCNVNITYVSNGEKKLLSLNASKQLEDTVYEVYKSAYVRRLGQKYNIKSFSVTSGSDWNCSFVWAYSSLRAVFAYYKTTEKISFYKLNILREFFTLDTKFNYFQAPIMGVDQQIFAYEKNFLDELYKNIFHAINQKATPVFKDKIFYDNYNNIIYLSNGVNSIQSVIINEVDEVYYHDNRLTFAVKDTEKEVNYVADKEFIEEFDNFVTTYNLRKIANSFDYSTDKLINATDNTKFIVDFTRDRVIYCANLNKFSQFSYITVAFSNLDSVKLEKSGENHFVRMFTKNKDIIDISCKKSSVAQYILAQLITIINS